MNVILDIGAGPGNSFGHWRDREKELAPAELYCFEPSPRHWPLLMMRAKEFSAVYEIFLCPFGLSDVTDVTEFHQKDDQAGDSFFVNFNRHDGLPLNNIECGYSLAVPRVSAGSFIDDIVDKDDSIYLKLDCEGSEYGILNSLLQYPWILRSIKEIQVEFHYPFEGKTDLEEKYKAKGIELKPWPY